MRKSLFIALLAFGLNITLGNEATPLRYGMLMSALEEEDVMEALDTAVEGMEDHEIQKLVYYRKPNGAGVLDSAILEEPQQVVEWLLDGWEDAATLQKALTNGKKDVDCALFMIALIESDETTNFIASTYGQEALIGILKSKMGEQGRTLAHALAKHATAFPLIWLQRKIGSEAVRQMLRTPDKKRVRPFLDAVYNEDEESVEGILGWMAGMLPRELNRPDSPVFRSMDGGRSCIGLRVAVAWQG